MPMRALHMSVAKEGVAKEMPHLLHYPTLAFADVARLRGHHRHIIQDKERASHILTPFQDNNLDGAPSGRIGVRSNAHKRNNRALLGSGLQPCASLRTYQDGGHAGEVSGESPARRPGQKPPRIRVKSSTAKPPGQRAPSSGTASDLVDVLASPCAQQARPPLYKPRTASCIPTP